jgi:hypothetical protein
MTSIVRWAIFLISLKLIILMIDETLKLEKSKRDYPIIPCKKDGIFIPFCYGGINIFMDPSI